jgi:acyl-coenzyme A synthetase/AMP-(fatty) acid ligase
MKGMIPINNLDAIQLRILDEIAENNGVTHWISASTAASIFSFMRERVSGYKLVRRIEFSDLPKTISGKIRRVDLRNQENTRVGSGVRNAREFLET